MYSSKITTGEYSPGDIEKKTLLPAIIKSMASWKAFIEKTYSDEKTNGVNRQAAVHYMGLHKKLLSFIQKNPKLSSPDILFSILDTLPLLSFYSLTQDYFHRASCEILEGVLNTLNSTERLSVQEKEKFLSTVIQYMVAWKVFIEKTYAKDDLESKQAMVSYKDLHERLLSFTQENPILSFPDISGVSPPELAQPPVHSVRSDLPNEPVVTRVSTEPVVQKDSTSKIMRRFTA
jgi:hypothetical protein